MGDQWVDPRKLNRPDAPGTRRGLAGRAGLRRATTRRGTGATGEEGEGDDRALAQPKSNTPLIVGIAIGGLVLVVLVIVAATSGGSRRPVPTGRTNDFSYSSPNLSELQESDKPQGYRAPGEISSKDCGSIRGICKACEYETDIATCINPTCKAVNFFFQHPDTYKFVCFRCGAESQPIKCEKCSGPLYKPKTKAR